MHENNCTKKQKVRNATSSPNKWCVPEGEKRKPSKAQLRKNKEEEDICIVGIYDYFVISELQVEYNLNWV